MRANEGEVPTDQEGKSGGDPEGLHPNCFLAAAFSWHTNERSTDRGRLMKHHNSPLPNVVPPNISRATGPHATEPRDCSPKALAILERQRINKRVSGRKFSHYSNCPQLDTQTG